MRKRQTCTSTYAKRTFLHSRFARLTRRKLESFEMLVVHLVGKKTNVPECLIFHRSRGCADIASARQLAMYLMHVCLGQNMAEVGSFFGRDRTTVAHACGRVEDRRDSPEFDAIVTQLEGAVCALAANYGQRPERMSQYAGL